MEKEKCINPSNPVYISYSWKDDDEDVRKICDLMYKNGIDYRRDVDGLCPIKANIAQVEKEIGDGDAIIVMISAKYMTSFHTMNEWHNILDKGDIARRVFVVVLEDARISEYDIFQERRGDLEKQFKEVDAIFQNCKKKHQLPSRHLSEVELSAHSNLGFVDDLDSLYAFCRNYNRGSKIEVHRATGFKEIIEPLKKYVTELAEASNAKKTIAELKAEIQRFKDAKDAGNAEKIKEYEAKIAELNNLLLQKDKEIRYLAAENDVLIAETNSLRTDNQSLKEKNDSLSKENQSLKKENQSFMKVKDSFKNVNESLLQKKADLQANVDKLKKEIQSLKKDNASLQSTIDQLKKDLESASKKQSNTSTSSSSSKYGNVIDLGLPTGTLWADRNIGANSPEESGYYFAWGEIEPKNGKYDWNTYRYNDNPKQLPPSNDAATQNWDSDWRMPTKEQFDELLKYCEWKWDGKGYKVIGKNGNSIYLPAAGYRYEKLEDEGQLGRFWSSSHGDSGRAWRLYFDSDRRRTYSGRRYYGFPVRAVWCKK